MRIFRKAFCVLLMICSFVSAFSKNWNSPGYSDAGSWNTFNIDYRINKKFTILFTEELRFRENYSRLNLFYTNLGIEYKANKYLKTALVYRWIDKFTDENNFSYRHRLSWDVVAKYPYKKFGVSYRHRLQSELRNINSAETGKVPEWYSRSKFELNYSLTKKLTPYISCEFRYQISDPRNIESDATWHRTRWQGGVDYQYTNKSKFGIYYLYQFEYNVPIQEKLFITGLEYSLSLNK